LLKIALALSGRRSYLLSLTIIIDPEKEAKIMSKSRDTQKEKKKPPQKSPKEKRKEKREKKNKS
jgi:hypothetical protein